MGDLKYHAKLRLVNGTWLPGPYIPDEKRDNELLHAIVHDDDVWIVSYPKSGTSWMQALVRLVCADETTRQNSQRLVSKESFIEVQSDIRDMFPIVQNAERPREIKTHLPFEFLPLGLRDGSTEAKLIYVARNAKDVCVSYYFFSRSYHPWNYAGTFEEYYDIFKEGIVHYGSWLKHVEGYWRERHRSNILFVTYEEMKQNLENVLHRVVFFLDKPPLTSEQVSLILSRLQFENLKKDDYFCSSKGENSMEMHDGLFMRKGIVGDWKNHMTLEMSNELGNRFQKPLEELGLFFEQLNPSH